MQNYNAFDEDEDKILDDDEETTEDETLDDDSLSDDDEELWTFPAEENRLPPLGVGCIVVQQGVTPFHDAIRFK